MMSESNPGEKQEDGMLISMPPKDEEEHPSSKCEKLFDGVIILVMVVMGLAIAAIFCSCFLALCIMGMLLLAVSYVIVRFLQLVTNGDAYNKATHVKTVIRLLIMEDMVIFFILLAIFYLVACKVSKLKHMTVYEVSIRHWIQVGYMIIGFYTFSFFLSYVVKSCSPPMLWQYERGINAAQSLTEIIDCLILWWFMSSFLKGVPPSYKQHQVMGWPTHKWIQAAIFILIGINIIALCCYLITALLHHGYKFLHPTPNVKSTRRLWVEGLLKRKHAMYWADGLRTNIVFVSSSMLLFFSWNSYLRTHLESTPEDKKVEVFVTMAFATLLTLAILWLIKSCILLSWKANQVYDQLTPRLLENREELYFLGMIGRHKFDIFSIRGYSPLSKEPLDSTPSFVNSIAFDSLTRTESIKTDQKSNKPHWHLSQLVGFVRHSKLIKIVRDDLYIWKVEGDVRMVGSEKLSATLHDIQKMSRYFLRAQPTLSSDKYVPDMLDYLTSSAAKCERSLEEQLEQLIKGKKIKQVEGDLNNKNDSQEEYEWKWFKELVHKQSHKLPSKEKNRSSKLSSVEISKTSSSSSNEINESRDSLSNATKGHRTIEKETLKAWLENARGTCMELANTVSSSEEVVNCLDSIISGLLIGATFIMWLLLTGLATTKILVLIASPLLAATFIFGETCKCLFQGIIFVYVRHPFNVGDLVIIDDKMMEVKILGIWQTIFVEIGKSDEVTYPNSELAIKKIINYKSDFDWNDSFEFSLKSFESDKIETLRKAIKEDLTKDEKCLPNHISTEVSAIDEDVKVIVHLKYNIDKQHSMTLYERLQQKQDYRSSLTIKIWNLLKEHKTKKD